MTNLSKIDIRKTTIFETAVDLRIMKIGEKQSIISHDVFDFVIDGTDLTSLVRTDDGCGSEFWSTEQLCNIRENNLY